MADDSKKEEEPVAGTLLVCGATDFYGIGRTKEVRPEYPNLSVPHRIKALEVRPRSSHQRAAVAARSTAPPHRSLQAVGPGVLCSTATRLGTPRCTGRESGLRRCWRLRLPLHHRGRERRVLHVGPQRGARSGCSALLGMQCTREPTGGPPACLRVGPLLAFWLSGLEAALHQRWQRLSLAAAERPAGPWRHHQPQQPRNRARPARQEGGGWLRGAQPLCGHHSHRRKLHLWAQPVRPAGHRLGEESQGRRGHPPHAAAGTSVAGVPTKRRPVGLPPSCRFPKPRALPCVGSTTLAQRGARCAPPLSPRLWCPSASRWGAASTSPRGCATARSGRRAARSTASWATAPTTRTTRVGRMTGACAAEGGRGLSTCWGRAAALLGALWRRCLQPLTLQSACPSLPPCSRQQREDGV